MTYTRTITIDWGVTGLTGTIAYTVISSAGATLVARTTVGVTETPAGSGIYKADVAAWDSDWVGRIVWDAGGTGVGSAAVEDFAPLAATSGSTINTSVEVTETDVEVS